jgi:hypothetical protein
MTLLLSLLLAAAPEPELLQRFEVAGWSNDTVALRETYDVTPPGDSDRAKECRYPGVKSPTAGVRLHFLKFERNVPLDLEQELKAASTFVIYESVPASGTCTAPDLSRTRLEEAKGYAEQHGIDFAAKPKRAALATPRVRGDGCFLARRPKECAGTAKVAGTALALQYQLTSGTPCPLSPREPIYHGCQATLRLDAEAWTAKGGTSFAAQHSGPMASGWFEVAALEAYLDANGAVAILVPFRQRFLELAWEKPWVVVFEAR